MSCSFDRNLPENQGKELPHILNRRGSTDLVSHPFYHILLVVGYVTDCFMYISHQSSELHLFLLSFSYKKSLVLKKDYFSVVSMVHYLMPINQFNGLQMFVLETECDCSAHVNTKII